MEPQLTEAAMEIALSDLRRIVQENKALRTANGRLHSELAAARLEHDKLKGEVQANLHAGPLATYSMLEEARDYVAAKIADYGLGSRPQSPPAWVLWMHDSLDFLMQRRRWSDEERGVDALAFAMKQKLLQKAAEGFSGWNDRDAVSDERLAEMLIDHLPKGDPVDIANFAMFLHQRGGGKALRIVALRRQLGALLNLTRHAFDGDPKAREWGIISQQIEHLIRDI